MDLILYVSNLLCHNINHFMGKCLLIELKYQNKYLTGSHPNSFNISWCHNQTRLYPDKLWWIKLMSFSRLVI